MALVPRFDSGAPPRQASQQISAAAFVAMTSGKVTNALDGRPSPPTRTKPERAGASRTSFRSLTHPPPLPVPRSSSPSAPLDGLESEAEPRKKGGREPCACGRSDQIRAHEVGSHQPSQKKRHWLRVSQSWTSLLYASAPAPQSRLTTHSVVACLFAQVEVSQSCLVVATFKSTLSLTAQEFTALAKSSQVWSPLSQPAAKDNAMTDAAIKTCFTDPPQRTPRERSSEAGRRPRPPHRAQGMRGYFLPNLSTPSSCICESSADRRKTGRLSRARLTASGETWRGRNSSGGQEFPVANAERGEFTGMCRICRFGDAERESTVTPERSVARRRSHCCSGTPLRVRADLDCRGRGKSGCSRSPKSRRGLVSFMLTRPELSGRTSKRQTRAPAQRSRDSARPGSREWAEAVPRSRPTSPDRGGAFSGHRNATWPAARTPPPPGSPRQRGWTGQRGGGRKSSTGSGRLALS